MASIPLNNRNDASFIGTRSEWSRNFGVVANDSSGAAMSQYMVRLERIDPTVGVGTDGERKNATELGAQSLVGLMTNNVQYSLAAGWDVSNNQVSSMMQGVAELLGGVGGFARLGGIEVGSAGYATRKVYKGGTDVSLSISFRLFDSTTNLSKAANDEGKAPVDTNTSVMDGVAWITSVMVPANKEIITREEILNFTTVLKAGSQTTEEREAEVKADEVNAEIIAENRDAVGNMTGGKRVLGVWDTIAGNANNEVGAFSINLTASPPPIRLQVGQWLYIKEAVVTNASFDFADKMSAKGPLFCDVTLTISTRENLMLTSDSDNEKTIIPQLQLFSPSGEWLNG